jgi:anthranilate synthase/aminodeoxychorismate synthase-like glutamine amidotransferase
MTVVILDNRDSFVFNLAHRLWEVGVESHVVRSDQVDVDEIAEMAPAAIVISPGPGHPDQAGCSVELVQRLSGVVPILGVCLGHQAIGVACGGTVSRDERPCHGRATPVTHSGHALFEGIPQTFRAGRYHSLALERPVPDSLEVLATGDQLVMAVAHRTHPTYGVQFHPESILSPEGTRLLANFAQLCGLEGARELR